MITQHRPVAGLDWLNKGRTQVSARDKKFFQGGESTCPNRTEHTLMMISFKKRVSDTFIKSRKELEGKVPKVIKDPNVFFSIHDQNIK
jgi:hypothetical protein